MCNTNILIMKIVIILEKAGKKRIINSKKRNQVGGSKEMLSPIDFDNKYKQVISNTDINIEKNLGLTSMKKY